MDLLVCLLYCTVHTYINSHLYLYMYIYMYVHMLSTRIFPSQLMLLPPPPVDALMLAPCSGVKIEFFTCSAVEYVGTLTNRV